MRAGAAWPFTTASDSCPTAGETSEIRLESGERSVWQFRRGCTPFYKRSIEFESVEFEVLRHSATRGVQLFPSCPSSSAWECSTFLFFPSFSQGKGMLLVLQDRMLNLIDPDDHSLLHSQPISSIRVWGVGRDHDRSVMWQIQL